MAFQQVTMSVRIATLTRLSTHSNYACALIKPRRLPLREPPASALPNAAKTTLKHLPRRGTSSVIDRSETTILADSWPDATERKERVCWHRIVDRCYICIDNRTGCSKTMTFSECTYARGFIIFTFGALEVMILEHLPLHQEVSGNRKADFHKSSYTLPTLNFLTSSRNPIIYDRLYGKASHLKRWIIQ